MIRTFAALISAVLLTLPACRGIAAETDDHCKLERVGEFDLLEDASGTPVISVMLDDKPAKMVLDTGAAWSGIAPSAVAAGYRMSEERRVGVVGAGGGTIHTVAIVPKFQLGVVTIKDGEFFVTAPQRNGDSDIAGNIGANILKHFDIEIDFPSRKVTLFSQDHCSGQVVSWAHDDLTVLPFKLNGFGHITIPVMLDGHRLNALLDTGASATFVNDGVAARVFGVVPDQPGTERAARASTLDGKLLPTYNHQFETLDLGGIKFEHPILAVASGLTGQASAEDLPELTLGMHQLRRLHLYIAYGERKLYMSIVPANAALGFDPVDRSELQRMLANADDSERAGRYGDAITALTQAIAMAPDLARLYDKRGQVQVRAGNLAAAVADFDHTLALEPANLPILEERAGVHEQLGDFPAVLADFAEILRVNPRDRVALGGSCELRLRLNQLDGALDDCSRALLVDPSDEAARLNRAWLYDHTKRYDLALADCDAVLASNPRSATALYYRGVIRLALNDRKGSRADLDAAYAIDPSLRHQSGER